MRKLLCFFFLSSLILVSCSKDSNNEPAEREEMKMSISSCHVVKNDNRQSENFASQIDLYILYHVTCDDTHLDFLRLSRFIMAVLAS